MYNENENKNENMCISRKQAVINQLFDMFENQTSKVVQGSE